MLSCLPRRGSFQRKPNKSCLCIERSPKSSWCLYKSCSYRDSGVHHPEVCFAPGMDALTQLPSLLGILQQDTERRPLGHGDVELDKSLLVLWQLSIRCRWEKRKGGQREKSGHSKSFKTSAPSLGPTTTFCHFCLHPQGVPPSPISPPAALLAQPCFCNTQTSVVSSPAPLPREKESQKHEPTLEDVLEEPSSLLEVARHRRSLRASAARPQTLKPDPKSLVGAVVAEQMEIMGRILLQLAPLSHVTQLGYRQAAHRHPGQPATSWQLNASSSAVSWFGGSLFLCF